MSRDASLDNLSYKFYIDSALTTPFSNLYQLTHNINFSDNPQDFTLYLGSTVSNRQLQANSDPGVDNITLTPVEQLAEWEAGTAYSAGDTVEPTVQNGFRYVCTTGGTSGSSEPTWPTSGIGSTVNDNGVVWELTSETHEPTEMTLALSESDLDGNTPGAALSLGATINSGTANAVEVWIRIENAVDIISNNAGNPELAFQFNEIIESATS
ncbi:hypothetical protein [Methylophaga sp. OBS4]|uniref:hypothetical protein n=1 Tax=Methylophaga sp. OBS4 TaxID=2991935 RepID=UPI00225796CB|nr:hypothetical protein [Methylophaga sp. OBS4]MCX4186777.1 hypothetical protein [Methylophaga sp. OBS4]